MLSASVKLNYFVSKSVKLLLLLLSLKDKLRSCENSRLG